MDASEVRARLLCAQGPQRRWRVGPYEFERYAGLVRRWGCTAHGRGVGNCRSPLGAFVALRRWLRTPSPPS